MTTTLFKTKNFPLDVRDRAKSQLHLRHDRDPVFLRSSEGDADSSWIPVFDDYQRLKLEFRQTPRARGKGTFVFK